MSEGKARSPKAWSPGMAKGADNLMDACQKLYELLCDACSEKPSVKNAMETVNLSYENWQSDIENINDLWTCVGVISQRWIWCVQHHG